MTLENGLQKRQQDPPSCPLLVPSKVRQIRLLIRKSRWVLPMYHVIAYSKVVHLEIWISWPTYLRLFPILIHGAFNLPLVLGRWDLEQFVEQQLLILRSTIHLEVFLKSFFENKTKFLGWFSRITQCVWLLTWAISASFLFLLRIKLFVELEIHYYKNWLIATFFGALRRAQKITASVNA